MLAKIEALEKKAACPMDELDDDKKSSCTSCYPVNSLFEVFTVSTIESKNWTDLLWCILLEKPWVGVTIFPPTI